MSVWLRRLFNVNDSLGPAIALLAALGALSLMGLSDAARILLALGALATVGWIALIYQKRLGMQDAEIRAAQGLIDRLVQEHWIFLSETNRALSLSLDLKETLATILRLPVPTMADHCRLYLRLPCGAELLVRPDPNAGVIEEQQRFPQAVSGVFDQGVSRILSAEESSGFGAGLRSLILIPMEARGSSIGVLALGLTRESRAYGDADIGMAEHVASRFALAIENARLYEQTRRTVLEREELLAVISHELKNSLAVIDVYAALALRQTEASAPIGLDPIEKIREAAGRMGKLIQDLLDLEKIKQGTFVARKQPESIVQVLKAASESVAPMAAGKSIRLVEKYPDHERLFNVDRDGVYRVMINLLVNAVKFVPEGGEIRVTAEFENGGIRVSVADNGPGIAADELPRIFERFWQSKDAANMGSGLGLAIVKGIVLAHGGDVKAESTTGQGAVFTFTLPSGN